MKEKKYQLNDEAIQYIILNVLYNIEKDIANEIDIDKVNFMHNLYTGFFWQFHYNEREYLKNKSFWYFKQQNISLPL